MHLAAKARAKLDVFTQIIYPFFSKVEIIEETIRYIDALHHQLAARIQPPPEVPEAAEQNCKCLGLTNSPI